LVGVDSKSIQSAFANWFPTSERMTFYGNGDASLKIVQVLKQNLS
jgi:hypothetical protein